MRDIIFVANASDQGLQRICCHARNQDLTTPQSQCCVFCAHGSVGYGLSCDTIYSSDLIVSEQIENSNILFHRNIF